MSDYTIPQSPFNDFLTNLVKLIPAEIVALYAVVQTFIPMTLVAHLFLAVPLVVLCPLYLLYAMKVKKIDQVVITTVAFVVWIFALGGPFKFISGYAPWMAGIALAVFTLIPPIIYGKRLPHPEPDTAAKPGKDIKMVKSWREI